MDAGEDSQGGDPACWAHLLCPECGAVLDAGPAEPVCPACGWSRRHADEE
ncbi:MAG TPA: hypothetical protein VKV06_06550 [Acidimicrobiales bacterium]|nr:hypothetical protein [Acidimicrobiales bacterium]